MTTITLSPLAAQMMRAVSLRDQAGHTRPGSSYLRGLSPRERAAETEMMCAGFVRRAAVRAGIAETDDLAALSSAVVAAHATDPYWRLYMISPIDSERAIYDHLSAAARARCDAALDRWRARRANRMPGAAPLADRLAAYRAGYRYGVSYPWASRVAHWRRSMDAARRHIESVYAPGHTSEPYVQLVAQSPLQRYLGRGGSVVAEWARGEWLSPLVAAGFAPRSIRRGARA